MIQTVPLLSGQRGASQPASASVLGSQLPRSPIPPQRPLQSPVAQSSRTQPPTGFMPRVVPLGQQPLYPSPGVHKQPAPGISLQQNQRPAPPAYNSRPAYQSTAYPRLAPKPTAGVNVQVSQVANQVPLISTVVGGRCTNSQLAARPSMPPQNSMPQSPATMVPSSLQSSPVPSGQQVANSRHDLPGGFGGSIRPKATQDVRQTKKDSAKGRIPEGVVLIAQEERAADLVSGSLIEGAAEQKIIVIENRTEISSGGKTLKTSNSRAAQDVTRDHNSLEEICPSNFVEIVERPSERLLHREQGDAVVNSPKTTFPRSSNCSLKRDLNSQTVLDSSGENVKCQKDMDACGLMKRPRLEKSISSFENELDNSSLTPSRTVSPTPLVNGDIKGDVKNKLVDKLLDKDLHLPINGVCGVENSELDLLASDGERLSSSKASSPDLFGSETNSDFGRYLEESETDTGLFSDILQGDLRIDLIENGTEGTHSLASKERGVSAVPHIDGGVVPNEQQAKVPISPSIRPEPQRPSEGDLPGQYNAVIGRNSDAVNVAWSSTITVTQAPKFGYINQKVVPDSQQKTTEYLQRGNQSANGTNVNNRRGMDSQGSSQHKPAFHHQPNRQQGISVQVSSPLRLPGVQQNIAPGIQVSGVVNNTVSMTRGSGTQQLSTGLPTAPPPYPGGQQTPAMQTSLESISAIVSRDMQAVSWPQSSISQPLQHRSGASGVQGGLQQNSLQGSHGPLGPPSVSGWEGRSPDVGAHHISNAEVTLCNSTGMAHDRQPVAALPSQYRQSPVPSVGKDAAPIPGPCLSLPELAPSTPRRHVNQADSTVPQATSFRPFRCRWTACCSSFDTSKTLFSHVVNEHVPRDSLVMSCLWEGCPPVRRSRSSLLFHLQQKHSEPSPVPGAVPPQPPPTQQQTPQPPPTSVSNPHVPAYHFLARMLQSLQGEEETPLTKSVRLTAALVLRNVAQYSSLAKSLLRRHESSLIPVAMSNSEAAHAVAACLSELSSHRKSSSNDSDSSIWAFNR